MTTLFPPRQESLAPPEHFRDALLEGGSNFMPPRDRGSRSGSESWDRQFFSRVADRNGFLEPPPGASGLVLFVHDAAGASQMPHNHFLAQCLVNQGLGVLPVELRTAVESGQPGGFEKDLGLMVERLTQVIQWGRGQSDWRDLTIGCLGFGWGGTAALMAAAALTAAIGALVVVDGKISSVSDQLRAAFAATLLVVNDGGDAERRWNEIAYARLRGDKELEILPRPDPAAQDQVTETIAGLAGRWFLRHLQPHDIASQLRAGRIL